MLNGVDPIIIFNLKKLAPSLQASISKVPIVASIVSAIDLPLIPIYLSEKLTGIYIESEDKNIDIDTQVQTLTDGSSPQIDQKGISSTVKVNMVATKDSIGVSIFAALADLIFPRVTSKEYSITYLHGAVTVFAGMLHSFSITQDANTDLYRISLELLKPSESFKEAISVVVKNTGTVPL